MFKIINPALLGCFFILICCSCNDKRNSPDFQKLETLSFDVVNWEEESYLPEKIINTVDFVPLETLDNNLIGKIDKVIIFEDKIYVLDSRYTKKIWVFTSGGKFICSIGHYGRGPGEYISLVDFIIDEYEKKLLVLDNKMRKVISYNLSSGDYIDELKINFVASGFSKVDENTLSFYSNHQPTQNGNQHLVANLNLEEKSYKWFINKDEYDTMIGTKNPMCQSEGLNFISFFKDTVYRIMPDTVVPHIVFDFGKYKISKEKLKSIKKSNELIHLLQSGYWIYGVENIVENQRFLTFDFKLGNSLVQVVYSKNTGSYYYGKGIDNGGLSTFGIIKNLSISDNQFIGTLDASKFLRSNEIIEQVGNLEFAEKYNDVAKFLSVNSNPVIIFTKYNNF